MRKGLRALRTGPERSTSGHEGKQPEALVHETTLSPSYPLRPLGWTSFTTPGATKEDRNSTRRMGCCKDTTCLANASSVLEDFTRHDYRLPKCSAQPQGPHYPMGTPSPAPGARGTLTAAPAQSPAGRGKEETATRARSRGPISPSPNTRATGRPRRAEAPPKKGSSEPSRKAGRTGVQVPAHWAASQCSLSCHCSGQGTHCGREEHEQHVKRWESQPSRGSWLLYCPKEPPNAKHLAWWHLQTC